MVCHQIAISTLTLNHFIKIVCKTCVNVPKNQKHVHARYSHIMEMNVQSRASIFYGEMKLRIVVMSIIQRKFLIYSLLRNLIKQILTGLHCPLEQIYHSCGNSCTRSCRDIALMGENCKPKCSDGCNCPEGLTLNSNGLCIPISKCPCSHNNLNYEAGEVLLMKYPESVQYWYECQHSFGSTVFYKIITLNVLFIILISLFASTCTNARWACRPATKLEIDRDYENGHQKCNESLNEEFTTCEPSEPKTCKVKITVL